MESSDKAPTAASPPEKEPVVTAAESSSTLASPARRHRWTDFLGYVENEIATVRSLSTFKNRYSIVLQRTNHLWDLVQFDLGASWKDLGDEHRASHEDMNRRIRELASLVSRVGSNLPPEEELASVSESANTALRTLLSLFDETVSPTSPGQWKRYGLWQNGRIQSLSAELSREKKKNAELLATLKNHSEPSPSSEAQEPTVSESDKRNARLVVVSEGNHTIVPPPTPLASADEKVDEQDFAPSSSDSSPSSSSLSSDDDNAEAEERPLGTVESIEESDVPVPLRKRKSLKRTSKSSEEKREARNERASKRQCRSLDSRYPNVSEISRVRVRGPVEKFLERNVTKVPESLTRDSSKWMNNVWLHLRFVDWAVAMKMGTICCRDTFVSVLEKSGYQSKTRSGTRQWVNVAFDVESMSAYLIISRRTIQRNTDRLKILGAMTNETLDERAEFLRLKRERFLLEEENDQE